jgi:hypothetical protein
VLSTVGNDAFAARCSFPPGGAAEAVALRVHATRQPSFLAGYYCKWVRGLSQTQWLAGDDHGGAATRVGDGSVEEQIALVVSPRGLGLGLGLGQPRASATAPWRSRSRSW